MAVQPLVFGDRYRVGFRLQRGFSMLRQDDYDGRAYLQIPSRGTMTYKDLSDDTVSVGALSLRGRVAGVADDAWLASKAAAEHRRQEARRIEREQKSNEARLRAEMRKRERAEGKKPEAARQVQRGHKPSAAPEQAHGTSKKMTAYGVPWEEENARMMRDIEARRLELGNG